MKTFPCAHLAVLPLAISAALVSPVALGQTQLGEIVITATRIPTRQDELVSDVVVINRASIENSTARTLSELLARNAGLQITANGGLGKNSSVFIRGTESRHTILLVDGVRYGSATTGAPSLDNIPVELIERIEVLKGPASALYGSEGVGGVIQIFTKQGRAGFSPYASLTLGSESHREFTAGASGGTDVLTYAVGVQGVRETGFSSTNPRVLFGNFNADNDGFRQSAFNGSFNYKIAPDFSLNAGLLYSDGTLQFDDGPTRDSRTDVITQVARLGFKGKLTDGWQSELRASSSKDQSNATVSAFPGRFNTTQTEITWQNDVATPIGQLLLGLEQREQKIDSDTAYTVTRRTISSAFAGFNQQIGGHSVQANFRYDKNSQFGSNDTGFIGYGYQFTPEFRLYGSYGTSFVAPSFNQLYFPGFGNSALQPEAGRNTELGASYRVNAHEFKLVRYDNKIRGFITNTTLAANIPRARIEGTSLSYNGTFDGSLKGLHLSASLDALDPRNELNGRLLPRRAKELATLGADYATGLWKFGATLLYVGDRFDDANNTPARALADFATLDLGAEYALDKEWRLQAKINNIADKVYETAFGFNQPRRGVFVTLRYQPK